MSRRAMIDKRNLIYDLVGITIFLVLGVFGLIVVSNPIRILIPNHPMISPQDWPGSLSSEGVEIIDGTQWNEKRELLIRLNLDKPGGYDTEITQNAIWHTNMEETALMWKESRLDRDWKLISENGISRDKPASRLYCRDDLNPPYKITCYFYAYRGHWFTTIHFTSKSDNSLIFAEIQRISARAEQLLMSVADEEIAAALPIKPETTSQPYVLVITEPPVATNQDITVTTPDPLHIPTPLIPPTLAHPGIPTIIQMVSCSSFQIGETRTVSADTFIFGNIIINGIEQYASNNATESAISFFETKSTVTTTSGADCYLGGKELINFVIQNELQHGCGSRCTSVRFVLVTKDGQFVEIHR